MWVPCNNLEFRRNQNKAYKISLIVEIVKEKSIEELNAQLVSLVGENGAVMLISAFKSSKSISAPLRWLGKF